MKTNKTPVTIAYVVTKANGKVIRAYKSFEPTFPAIKAVGMTYLNNTTDYRVETVKYPTPEQLRGVTQATIYKF